MKAKNRNLMWFFEAIMSLPLLVAIVFALNDLNPLLFILSIFIISVINALFYRPLIWALYERKGAFVTANITWLIIQFIMIYIGLAIMRL